MALVGALLLSAPAALANGVPLNNGDVLAAVGNGQVDHYSSSGTLLDTLDTGTGASYTTGMCFDAGHNLFVTDFSQDISEFNSGGNLVNGTWVSSYPGSAESCTFNASGDMFVGAPGQSTIYEYDPSGNQINTFDVATDPTGGTNGSDWVDLESDQCTLLYADEGNQIKSYNVCTSTQNADFADNLPGPCYELRVRPNGEVIIACDQQAVRLDSSGNTLQTYTVPNTSQLFAMNLDPDGTSFWTGDIGDGEITHVDIATGNTLEQFQSNPNTQLAGLSIVGGIVVSVPNLTLAPSSQTATIGSPATVTATLDVNGSPKSGATILFSVAGANTSSGSGSTNASGQATFSYSGTNAGTDTVTACYDANNNGVCDSGEATATATVTWSQSSQSDPAIRDVRGLSFLAHEGIEARFKVASFKDPDSSGVPSDYTATINWGDGRSSTGTVEEVSGVFYVLGTHKYFHTSHYTVTVSIVDADGPSEPSATGMATVVARSHTGSLRRARARLVRHRSHR